MPSSTTKPWLRELWSTSVQGVRANLVPGLALWFVGLGVVWLYYFVDSTEGLFLTITDLKVRHGYAYSGVATALFGGLIPFAYLWCSKRVPPGCALAWALFYVIYWAIRGIEVDALYRLQAWFFGNDTQWQTILTKVLVDQFIYCPFWSAPVTAICFGWRDSGFSWTRFKPRLTSRFFLFDIPSVLLSIWIVWIPATAIIYALPLPLQIPLFNLVLCFFVLLISVLSGKRAAPAKGG